MKQVDVLESPIHGPPLSDEEERSHVRTCSEHVADMTRKELVLSYRVVESAVRAQDPMTDADVVWVTILMTEMEDRGIVSVH